MSLEQEIKLQVLQEKRLDLVNLAVLKPYIKTAPLTQSLVTVYFDTLDKRLMEEGLSLRLRQVDSKCFQTLKAKGKVSDGLHQREEWEYEIDAPKFKIDDFVGTPLTPFLEKTGIISALKAIFTTEFERLIIMLMLPNSTEVELAYDRGLVKSGEKNQGIHEVELELKQGDIEQMKVLAEELVSILPVEYSDTSKAQLGYQLSEQ